MALSRVVVVGKAAHPVDITVALDYCARLLDYIASAIAFTFLERPMHMTLPARCQTTHRKIVFVSIFIYIFTHRHPTKRVQVIRF